MNGFDRERFLTRAWLFAAFVLLLFPAVYWLRIPAVDRTSFTPVTPIDRTASIDPAEWNFLWKVREIVPAKHSVVLVARSGDEAMTLFMMSLGVMTDEVVLPGYYYGFDHPEMIRDAEYVASFRCAAVSGLTTARLRAKFDEGCLYQKGSR